MNRTYKYQVINKIKELQENNSDYGSDLRKFYSAPHQCYRWSISRAYSQRVELGDTLADAMETLDAMLDDYAWREEQQAKWEAENS